MARPQLVIIPGLGDRGTLYRFVKPSWARHGYQVHVFFFGWNEDVLLFQTAHEKLLRFLDSLNSDVCIIGVSAGGTAAVNAVADRPYSIKKVVTISSPYQPIPNLSNKLLLHSIAHLETMLERMDNRSKGKILSIHGLYDQIVHVSWSKPKGIRAKTLFSFWHVPSVVVGMIIGSRTIRRFFAEAEK